MDFRFKIRLFWQSLSKNKTLVKINRILFWWYYKRIPDFYRQWTILASIRIFSGGYNQIEREWRSEAKRADKYFSQIVELERNQK